MSEPVSENFASLLTADLCTNTDAFLTVYRDGVSQSSDPIAALTRFSVESLTANKSDTFLRHELISVSVKDRETKKLYNFFIERNPSKVKVRPFTLSSLSPDLTSASITSTREVETRARQSSEIPLLPLNAASESVSSLYPPTRPHRSKSHYSLREKFSITQIMHSSSMSFDSVAEDRILGRGMFVKDSNVGIHREIGLIVGQVVPVGLSLFELGIIVDVIHNEEPDYSIFKNQCYWFLNTIFKVVGILHQDNLDETPNNLIPSDYLPNLAGRCMNVLIIDPKDDLLHKIANRFLERRNKEFSKVCLHSLCFFYF
jgi:hypothetical protein